MLIHGIAGSSGTWVPVHAAAGRAPHGDRARPARPRRVGQAPRRLQPRRLRLRRPRPPRRCSATTGPRSSATASAAASPCSSPTSSRRWCERLVLVGSGGLGKEVSPLLRALSAPGTEYVLPVVLSTRSSTASLGAVGRRRRPARAAGRPVPRPRSGTRTPASPTPGPSGPSSTRSGPSSTLAGQRVSARDRLYLAARRAHPDRVGRPRQRHPRRARATSPTS